MFIITLHTLQIRHFFNNKTFCRKKLLSKNNPKYTDKWFLFEGQGKQIEPVIPPPPIVSLRVINRLIVWYKLIINGGDNKLACILCINDVAKCIIKISVTLLLTIDSHYYDS